jgi:hypothetical protein
MKLFIGVRMALYMCFTRGGEHRAQNSTRQELTDYSHNWTNAPLLVVATLNNKMLSIDGTCCLLC